MEVNRAARQPISGNTEQTSEVVQREIQPRPPLSRSDLAECLNKETNTTADILKTLRGMKDLDLAGQTLTAHGVIALTNVIAQGNFKKLTLRETVLPRISSVLETFKTWIEIFSLIFPNSWAHSRRTSHLKS